MKDQQNNEILPYVNIGIKNKNTGTASLSDGTFSLNLSSQFENDMLSFSVVGFEELNIPIRNIPINKQNVFKLIRKPFSLEQITVNAKKPVEKKYGIVKYNPLFHFIDASLDRTDIYEIAQLLHFSKVLSKITSVNLFINASTNDSALFRINFYKYTDGVPGERLIEKSILQKHLIKEGWLRFDLLPYNIFLNNDIIVAIELIPPAKKSSAVTYEVKLGGHTKSFSRSSSFGTWQSPTHHYRLFVTAFSSEEASEKSKHEEDESLPVFRFFSKIVLDSFSIFVSLPKNYNRNGTKKYPVVYVLDANAYFDALSDFLIESHNTEQILVGIGYENAFVGDTLRVRDYGNPGGASNFIGFIEKELLPEIDERYSTDPAKRTMMGHSLGGYFALYLMSLELNTQQPFFSNYISISPSLDYANDYLFTLFKNITTGAQVPKLYLATGQYEDVNRFNDFLNVLKTKKIPETNDILLKCDHMEAALPGFKKGLGKLNR